MRRLCVLQVMLALAGCRSAQEAETARPRDAAHPLALGALPGEAFNVKGFGAKGDGSDDTAAVLAAIAAAGAQDAMPASVRGGFGRGGVVFFPRGIYSVKEELRVGQGVTIVGAGRQSTEIVVQQADAAADGIAWKSPGQYGFGGGLRDITIAAGPGSRVRDLVSLVNWGNFEIANVNLLGGGRYALYMADGISTTVRDTVAGGAVAAGVWIGDTIGSVATSTQFFGCYFSNNSNGPGADVAGLGITFVASIFESNGEHDATNGAGIRVRSGEATLIAPYFENNASWHMWLGSDPVGKARVTVVEPVMRNGPYTTRDHGAVLADHLVGGAFIGGDFSQIGPSTIHFTPASHGVAVLGAEVGPNTPSYDLVGGRSIADYPGVVQHTDPATGDVRLTGRYNIPLTGGSSALALSKRLMGTKTWMGGAIAASSAVVIDVPVPATSVGDQILVTSIPPWTDGLSVSGIVVAPGSVHVTIANATRSAIRAPCLTVKVAALRLVGD